MNSVYLVNGLQYYIALCSLCGSQFSSTFLNINGPFYISDKYTKREIVRMFCKRIICSFPMLQSAPTMATDRSITQPGIIRNFSEQ